MSGPKGGSYSVANNLALERQALEAARTRATSLLSDLRRLRSEAEAFSSQHPDHAITIAEPGSHPGTADRATVDHLISMASTALSDGRAALSAAKVAVCVGLVAASLGTGGGRRAASVTDRLAEAAPFEAPIKAAGRTGSTSKKKSENPTEFVARIVALLDGDAPSAEREAVESIATAVLTLDTGAISAHRVQLRLEVDAANAAAARVRADRELAERLRSELLGHSGPKVEALVSELNSIADGKAFPSPGLEDRVSTVVASAKDDADRSYAATVLSEELCALGYDVGPEFSTQLGSHTTAEAGRPDWGPYAVRIRFDDPDGINLHVVRDDAGPAASAANQRQRDREVEESWCADLGLVQDRLSARGVQLDLVEKIAPGVLPVPAVKGVEQRLNSRRAQAKQQSERHQ
jgi:hypothetical protein